MVMAAKEHKVMTSNVELLCVAVFRVHKRNKCYTRMLDK